MPATRSRLRSDADLVLRAARERFRAGEGNVAELLIASDAARDGGDDGRADLLRAVADMTAWAQGRLDPPAVAACEVGRWDFTVWAVRPAGRTRYCRCRVDPASPAGPWRFKVKSTKGWWPRRSVDLRAWLGRDR